MTDEPLIKETDALFRQLLKEAKGDKVEFSEKLSLGGRLTAYLQVKHRLEDGKDGKGGSFDDWRKQHETQSGGAGSARPKRAKRRPKHPANADAAGLADGLPDTGSDDRSVPRFGDDLGHPAATALGPHRRNGAFSDGDE